MYSDSEWTVGSAIPPVVSTALAFIFALVILAYPPPRFYKKLSILLLALPVAFAFTRQHDLVPNWMACDTFGRFLYIWLAHMSYEVVILEFEPTGEGMKDNVKKDWKIRIREAYRVLFDRNHNQLQQGTAQPIQKKHDFSRNRFVFYHVRQAVLLYLAQAAWFAYDELLPTTREHYTPEQAYFFRRLTSSPSSLDLRELYFRFELAFDWSVINMFFYESYHSVFAVLFVGILRLDSPEEWSLSLCGSLREAWSVRRYWGKHWHNYIYHSFSAHTKIVTRSWLGFERGRGTTRLLENMLIFLASGLMHSLVRWQQNPDGDMWCITLWYIGQMLPIVIEGMIQDCWRKVRSRLGFAANDKRINALERAVGYLWVACWFMWSIPKYVHTKNAWTMERIKKKYPSRYVDFDKPLRNDTE